MSTKDSLQKKIAKQRWFQTEIFGWYKRYKRDLPWRRTSDPYRILVSEIMLQQTQVDRVIPKYQAFLRRFPTPKILARARRSSVVLAWAGLGYNNRAVRLQSAVQKIVQRDGGFPKTVEAWEALPGIGPYTARALAAFSLHLDVAAIDTNHSRVVGRFFFGLKMPSKKSLDRFAHNLVPKRRGYQWNHSLMDFGALVCRSRPRCDICPLQSQCAAYPQVLSLPKSRSKNSSIFLGSNRYFRGRIIALLRENLSKPPLELSELLSKLRKEHILSEKKLTLLIHQLEKDGLIRIQRIEQEFYVKLR